MASKKSKDISRLLHHYRQVTGKQEVDMDDVAKFAVERMGWELPEPVDPLKRLSKDLSRAAREEMRYDKTTGRPYRANHAVPINRGGQTSFLWIDIDDAPRKLMHKSLQHRREQMVGDGVQLRLDQDHWNDAHPGEDPIQIELDFTDDVEWRLNADQDEKKTG